MSEYDKDYVGYRIERSKELFQDAKILAEHKRWKSSVNRLYYSSFQLVSALLNKHGINPKTHNGLRVKFVQEYVKTNLIDTDLGKLFTKLFDWRQESDYTAFVDFKEDDVLPLIERVEQLNRVLINLINEDK
ncbi:MAG: HEPN domain-containing protein [Bacteroidales bacterium]|nr:HEPN domain-containing protein [Bacteroidales bacterium]MCF8337720.1 HEPN domain-containing protein [Bacteroidales bacterium]